MKLNKKWWLIIGFSVIALISVVLVIVLVVVNSQDDDVKPKYSIAITTTNSEFGVITGRSDTGLYEEGESVTLTFKPYENRCIESIFIDGVNVFDYILDSTINVQNEFSYTFENLKENHNVEIKFDEIMNLDGLGYTTRQESGVADMEYGQLEIWGASEVFPKSGRVKLQVVSSIHYDFYSYILPSERDSEKSYSENYTYVDSSNSKTMSYDSESQTFTMSSAFVKLSQFEGYDLELIFVPNSIDLVVYFSDDGETFIQGLTETQKLYNEYKIDISYMEDYTWYSCKRSEVNASNILNREVEIIEKDIQGVVSKYINLHHDLYADNIDSRKIILVCVLNTD